MFTPPDTAHRPRVQLRLLNAPYVNDLAALINDAAFKQATGNGINARLSTILDDVRQRALA